MDVKSSRHPAPLAQIELSPSNLDTLDGLAWALGCSRDKFRLFLLRCDYTTLRAAAIARLQDACATPLEPIALASEETRLFSVLADRFDLADPERRPSGILVTGLEGLCDRDGFLATLNQMRESFRERCPLPIVLLVEADLVARFQRQAKDFETWASIDVLDVEPSVLEGWLTGQRDRLFAALIDIGAPPIEQPLLDTFKLPDVAAALRDLQQLRPTETIEPDVLAFYDFLRGRDAYERDRLDEAIDCYRRSQQRRAPEPEFTPESSPEPDLEPDSEPNPTIAPNRVSEVLRDRLLANLNALAEVVTLHVALCYYRRTVLLNRPGDDLAIARDLLASALDRCERQQAWAIVSRFIGVSGEVQRDLAEWEGLRPLLARAMWLHRHRAPQELPRDYSLCADLALAEGDPVRALRWLDRAEARIGAMTVALEKVGASEAIGPLALRLSEIRARSWLALDRPQAAISLLERHRARPCPKHPQLYIALLDRLRSLYFQRQQYWQAFGVRCDRQAFEHDRGLKAFIGAARLRSQVADGVRPFTSIAPEIAASGRQQDIQNLVERIERKDLKVTVIYGFSGVGKSSLIHAGLIPTLRRRTIETQTIAPIALQLYDDWWNVLRAQLADDTDEAEDLGLNAACQEILARLWQEDAANRRVVLIFDQFEEFFFRYRLKTDRNRLFVFLGRCLDIPSLRVVFSIRRTYLYFLLNRPGLDCIDNDILSKRVLYRIGNFSADATRAILQQLTERASFNLEPELVEMLIADLEAGYGKVRPIELQIVGAQLQQDGVTTLAAYQRTGGKTALVQRYLDRAIDDCGPEHHTLAELVLYLLAEKPKNRPIKTQSELEKEVELFSSRGQFPGLEAAVSEIQADRAPSPTRNFDLEPSPADPAAPRSEIVGLILKIFVGSGLAFQIPADLELRYQLAHDYLAELVRQHYSERFSTPLEALQREKSLRSSTERELRAALRRETQARHAAEVAQIEAAVRSSQILLAFDDRREALTAVLDAGRRLKEIKVPLTLRFLVLDALRRAVYGARQLDRLRGHDGWIDCVAIAPAGAPIASGGSDGTVRLWFPMEFPVGFPKAQASLCLDPDCDWVDAVAFSPDGQWLAAAGDRAVFLWPVADLPPSTGDRATLKPALTIDDRTDWVRAIAFSPDGQTLTIGCHDGTLEVVTLQLDRTQRRTVPAAYLARSATALDSAIGSLCGLPGNRVVVGTLDGRVLLWDFGRDRPSALLELGEHDDEIVSLTVRRRQVWASSRDGAIYRWPLDGSGLANPDRARYRQGERLTSFAVDRAGQRIAAGDNTGTVRVWDARGREIEHFTPHRDAIRALCFSPSGNTIASGSDDRTLSLWQSAQHQPGTLSRHERWLACIAISPDGRYGLSADGSGEIAIWSPTQSDRGDGKGDATLRRWQGFDRPIRSAVLRQLPADLDLKSELSPAPNVGPNSELNPNPIYEVAAIDRVGITRTWTIDGQPRATIAPPIDVELAWTGIASHDAIYASHDGRIWLADRSGKVWLSLRCQQGEPRRGDRTNSPNDKPSPSEPPGLDICQICISGDRRQLAIGHRTGTVEIWAIDPASSTAAFLYPIVTHTRAIGCLAFSPDDRLLAIGDYDRNLSVWTLADRQSRLCKGHAAAINTVTFGRGGQILISGSYDRTIRFWDTATGKALHAVTDAAASVEALQLLPDRCALVSASRDRRVRLWNFDLDDLLARGDATISSPASL